MMDKMDKLKDFIDNLSDEEMERLDNQIEKEMIRMDRLLNDVCEGKISNHEDTQDIRYKNNIELNDDVIDLREFMTFEEMETFNMCKHIMGKC
tara:strand:- start:616 stop:894 length:279 start_codon:yes stop_codon:yes gene_type:complete